MSDNINPNHYKNSTSLECIESMMIAFGRESVLNFCMLNAYKYIWRWKNKNGYEDLEKAQWYIDRARKIIYDPETSSAFKSYLNIFAEMAIYIERMIKEEAKEEKEETF